MKNAPAASMMSPTSPAASDHERPAMTAMSVMNQTGRLASMTTDPATAGSTTLEFILH